MPTVLPRPSCSAWPRCCARRILAQLSRRAPRSGGCTRRVDSVRPYPARLARFSGEECSASLQCTVGCAELGLCRARTVMPANTRMLAAPRSRLPERSVDVMCKCGTRLFKYKKGGNGSLVKCYVERIVTDFRTEEDQASGELRCPSCGNQFARHALVHGRPAYKMIGGTLLACLSALPRLLTLCSRIRRQSHAEEVSQRMELLPSVRTRSYERRNFLYWCSSDVFTECLMGLRARERCRGIFTTQAWADRLALDLS